jgi:hypothetical protein
MTSAYRKMEPVIGAALLGLAIGIAYELGRKAGRAGSVGSSTPPVKNPITQSQVPINPADAHLGEPGRNTEQRLDEAVQETFPASDPISLKIEP